jgi:hypothetical protein
VVRRFPGWGTIMRSAIIRWSLVVVVIAPVTFAAAAGAFVR